MSSLRGSWYDVEDEDEDENENEKLDINEKVLKFRNKTWRDCGKLTSVYILESLQILRICTTNVKIKAVISLGGGNQVCMSIK